MFTGVPLKKTVRIFQNFSGVLPSGCVKTRAVFWLKKKNKIYSINKAHSHKAFISFIHDNTFPVSLL